jgi:hypothetical protein
MPAEDGAYSQEELEAAVEALSDPERFAEAERVVSSVAPGLQKVLAVALASGGWFEESHQQAIGDAAGREDPSERVAMLRTLLAEESRVAMMIGVAVGWALAGELGETAPTTNQEETDPQ